MAGEELHRAEVDPEVGRRPVLIGVVAHNLGEVAVQAGFGRRLDPGGIQAIAVDQIRPLLGGDEARPVIHQAVVEGPIAEPGTVLVDRHIALHRRHQGWRYLDLILGQQVGMDQGMLLEGVARIVVLGVLRQALASALVHRHRHLLPLGEHRRDITPGDQARRDVHHHSPGIDLGRNVDRRAVRAEGGHPRRWRLAIDPRPASRFAHTGCPDHRFDRPRLLNRDRRADQRHAGDDQTHGLRPGSRSGNPGDAGDDGGHGVIQERKELKDWKSG